MVSHQLEKISDYYRFLKENPSEVEILFKELLINVTNFFRDTDGFETIKNVVLPRILKTKKEGEVIRIWVAGCSTGEEAYSIAIIVNEVLSSEEKNKKLKVQIFATDIDEISIEKARSGIFAMDITGFVSPERLQNYFIKKTNGYVIKKEIREMVVFAPQSIIKDPPFTKLDVISCRNLLIYLNTEIQKKIMTLFHYSLNKKGYLFLGASEGISGYTNLYEPLESKHRIYQKKESAEAIHEIIHFPLVPSQEHKIKSSAENIQSRKRPSAELSTIIQKSLLDKYAPPSVITNKAGDIIYVNGNTSKYLELSSGQLNTNIFNMCSDSLSFELKSAIAELSKQKSKIIQKNVKIKCNGDLFLINLSVKALGDSKDLSGLILVVFEDDKFSHSKPLGKKNKKNGEESSSLSLESELEYTKQQYQQTLEQMEASLEELTLVAEESQSTNEELQSANEELTTSKEEMQSLNEELVALNAEMHTKMEEYTQTSSDMRNLLYSTQIATIFLDKDLTLRYFTPQTNKIIKLIKTDIGRPITDLALNLEYDYLIEDVKEVIEFLSIKELQVQTFSKIWYAMRISPYKTIDNYIDGVVLTFTDITLHKKYDEEKFAREFAENIINTMREPLVVLDSFLKIISVNNAFYKVFDLKKENVIGKDLFMISNGSWDIPPLKELLLEILPQKNELEDFEVVHTFEGIGKKRILLNARTMIGAHKQAGMILLAMEVFSA
jgi:two-component system CheB/CheR fusion protein